MHTEWPKKTLCLTATLMFVFAAGALAQDAGDSAWWQEAAQPYQGVTIRGISESTPPSSYVSDVLAPAFTEATGINVEFEITSWDQMYDKAIKDMQANTGIYDFVYVEQDIVYSYLAQDFLVDLTEMLNGNEALQAPDFTFDNFTSFIDYFKNDAGNVFGVPMEAFVKPYLYRTDLFNDEAIKTAFQEQYGYELAPAKTFQEYKDVADFFTQYGEENDMELWGTTLQASTGHAASTYEVLETIFPAFGVYNWGINQENYKATEADGGELNSDRAKEALAYWIGLLSDAPPEATSSTWDEVASTFAAGRAAQGWVYGENAAWIATDESRSTVVGKVGVALPPLGESVLEQAEADEGYIGYYDGGAFAIPHSSKNQEAAALWLQYIGQPSVQADWAVAGSRITHTDTFDDPKVQAVDEETNGYFTLLEEEGDLFAGAPPFPFHNPVRETIDTYVHRAIAGELTPEEALDQAAEAVNQTLVDLGYAQ